MTVSHATTFARGSAELPLSPSLSRAVKGEYCELISTQPDFELAETYYNSIHRRIAPTSASTKPNRSCGANSTSRR